MKNYKFPMPVQYEDGTMGHQRWGKNVTGLAVRNPVCSFGLSGDRFCIIDLKDMPVETSLTQVQQNEKNFPDVVDWLGMNLEVVNETLAMLRDDGYDVDPIMTDRAYKAFCVNVNGVTNCAHAKEVLVDLKKRQISANVGNDPHHVRACRYFYV